jgi:hypothetical protein
LHFRDRGKNSWKNDLHFRDRGKINWKNDLHLSAKPRWRWLAGVACGGRVAARHDPTSSRSCLRRRAWFGRTCVCAQTCVCPNLFLFIYDFMLNLLSLMKIIVVKFI